jgi:hypothetical protein
MSCSVIDSGVSPAAKEQHGQGDRRGRLTRLKWSEKQPCMVLCANVCYFIETLWLRRAQTWHKSWQKPCTTPTRRKLGL